jgi:hypothetical protein
MTKLEVLIAIISSSVVATILTSFVNWLIHRSNYRNEYYKSILNKRLSAYEEVSSIVFDMSILMNEDEMVFHQIFYGKDEYVDFIQKLVATNTHSFWVSSRVAGKLTEINVYLLNNIDNHLVESIDRGEQIKTLGKANVEEVRNLRRELSNLMSKDFRKLYKVRSFLRSTDSKINEHGVERKY